MHYSSNKSCNQLKNNLTIFLATWRAALDVIYPDGFVQTNFHSRFCEGGMEGQQLLHS